MPVYSFENFVPEIHESVFLAPTAEIIGRVKLAKDSNIWFGTVIRGDENFIEVGEGTNVQDLSLLHITAQNPLIVGNYVTIGHNVILHACTVGDNCLIGMGAIVLDGAIIGKNSLVAAGSVVSPGKEFPANSLIMGSPARVVRELRPDEIEKYGKHYLGYIHTKNLYSDPSKYRLIRS